MQGQDRQDPRFGNPYAPPVAPVAEPTSFVGGQELASRGQRVLAILVDAAPGVVIGLGGAAVAIAVGFGRHRAPEASGFPMAMIALLAVAGIAMVAWTIVSLVFVYQYGQTIGKRVIGIRVVRMDGSRISFPRIFFMRGLLAALPGAIPWLGWIYRIADYAFVLGEPRRCIHDYIADSKVVTAASSENATLAGSRG